MPDDEYQGIMLVNPGGPGGSGLIFAILGAFVPGGAGEAYDWIGFDPRASATAFPRCTVSPRTRRAHGRPTIRRLVIEAAWLDKVAAYAADCDHAAAGSSTI